MANNISPPIAIPADFELEDLWPMMPPLGPPLPSFLEIYWPWYKVTPEVPPEEPPPYVPPEEPPPYVPPEEPPEEQPLTELTDADVVVSRLVAVPQVVEVGQTVDISVNVGNPNDFAGSYLVKLSGAITSEQGAVLKPHETKKVIFREVVDWEGYQDIYCSNLSVTVRGEIVGPAPPDAFRCPLCGAKFDSDREVGFHLATEHFGYSASGVPCNDGFIGDLGKKLWTYRYLDVDPEGEETAEWALSNAASGGLLYGCLGSSNLSHYLVYQLGVKYENQYKYISSLVPYGGGSYWNKYALVSDIAPGWYPGLNFPMGWPTGATSDMIWLPDGRFWPSPEIDGPCWQVPPPDSCYITPPWP